MSIFKDQRELSFVNDNIMIAEQGAVTLKSIIINPCCMYVCVGKHCKPILQFARNEEAVRAPPTHPPALEATLNVKVAH